MSLLRSQWTRFLLPDVFVHVPQVLFNSLAGCIDLPAKQTQLSSDITLGLHFQLLLEVLVAQDVGHSKSGVFLDYLIVV